MALLCSAKQGKALHASVTAIGGGSTHHTNYLSQSKTKAGRSLFKAFTKSSYSVKKSIVIALKKSSYSTPHP